MSVIAINSYREQEYHFGLAMPKEALVSNVTLKTIGKNGHTTGNTDCRVFKKGIQSVKVFWL